MCDCLSRRQFTMLVASTIAIPTIARAQNVDAIRALNGALDVEAFRGKQAARLSAREAQTVFVIGEDAFLTDEAFTAEVSLDEAGVVAKLKILSGQTLAALKPRNNRATDLVMPNSTASVRGTGFYVNVGISRPHDYICCCYGHIAFNDSSTSAPQILKNSYHNATAINEIGDFVTPEFDYPYGHYDDELVMLEAAVNRRPHWHLPDDKMHFLSPQGVPQLG